MTTRRRSAWGLVAFLVAAGLLLVALPGVPLVGRAGAAGAITVSVTPTDQLADGQFVTVTIKAPVDNPVTKAKIQLCRDGVSYGTTHGPQPPNDGFTGGPNCPRQPVSSSGDLVIDVPAVQKTSVTDQGSITRFRVGMGNVSWQNVFDQSTDSLTCDQDNPCDLLVEAADSNGLWTPYPTKVTFQNSDPVAGCGGAADGVLTAAGSDRMQDAWISWTLDQCHQDGAHGGASRTVFNGEGTAVNSFATGKADIAYTAAGYNADVGLLDAANKDAARPFVAIPVALNSAVLAVAGGYKDANDLKVPYTQVRLKEEEVAQLFSGGALSFTPSNDLNQRNPLLNGNFFDTGASAGWLVAAPAEAESVSWFMTEEFLKNVPDSWKVPDEPRFGPERGLARGATSTMGTATPSFALALTTLTGRPPLANGVAKIYLNNQSIGGAWVLTDNVTAAALTLTTVDMANASGDFVPVNKDTVTAGVKSMKTTDDGMLIPDPKATAKVDGVTPDPLAFVEYALVPAEPLVDKDCNARTASQTLLTSWLTYVTGPGQQKLPAGMYPLTSELQQQAQDRIGKVGTADVTGDCAGKVATPAPTTTTTTTAPAASGGSETTGGTTGGTGDGSTGGSFRTSTPSSHHTSTPLYASTQTPTASSPSGGDKLRLTSIPGFGGRKSIGWIGTLLAMVALTGLSGLAALAASGRSIGGLKLPVRRRGPS